ncbi:MAG TPA: hypothetical protein VFF69_11260, partial [Phycisphaerales bacterium]|nr:hypothetical protein [Phycisphaerales bacterium]
MPHDADAWTLHMRRAEFEDAWRISDRVLRLRAGLDCSHWPRHEQFVWRGEPLAGSRVLLRCYHGLGDTIQFIRYAPLVSALAREVTVWAQPELLPLLSSARGIDRLLPLHDGAPQCEYEAEAELSELPHIFRTTARTIPADVPYLRVAPRTPAQDGSVHVGVVWGAGGWDERRSIPFPEVERLSEIRGVTLHVLQRGPRLGERPDRWGLLSGSDDVLEAARVIRGLDLV